MKEGKSVGRISGVALVLVMVVAMLGGLLSTGNAIVGTTDVYASSSYNRQAAYNYAQVYWDEVCSDGYYMAVDATGTTYAVPFALGTSYLQVQNYFDNHTPILYGADCAHFVSCCIGDDGGGGLSVPHDYSPYVYGYVGALRLANWILSSGYGVQKYSISDLEMGDVVLYRWWSDTDSSWHYHIVLYVGAGKIAAHSACCWGANWDQSSNGMQVDKLIHIIGGDCPYSCWDRSALSGDELAALVRSHFPLGGVTQTGESRRVTAYAIAKAESGGNPSACGPVGEIGLWQIHPPSHPSYDECLLFEEDYNANAAREISSNGNNWNPWCTYEDTCYCSVCTGTYRDYLTEARKHFYPKVTSLSVSSTSINLGETVRIYYSVSDDVGLDRVELWRAIDVNGDGQPDGFNLIDTKPASGQSASGYFDDNTHPSPDTYWYGIHVVDNSGAPEAWNCERNSRTGNWPGVYGPDRVEVTSPINNPPNAPSNPSPPNHEPDASINADLSWMGGDPDPGDTVTYDVYFGTSSSPPLVSNDQSGTTYNPGTLAYGTKYYWKVVATDNHGASTPGSLWDFTTQSPGNNPPNTPSNPSPPTHEPGVSTNADLSWTGGDPDLGDTVTYDVYFGASSTPPLVSNDQSGTTYDPGTLAYGTKYYWKIVATDNHEASTPGPVWDFTTESAGPNEWKSPSATGDQFNEWINPTNAYSSDNQYADCGLAEPQHAYQDYYNFDFSIPSDVIIQGIEVRCEGHTTDTGQMIWIARLSGDGGSTWSSDGRSPDVNLNTDTTVYIGGSSDLWGKSWTPSNFSNANFRLLIFPLRLSWTEDPHHLDHIQVKVYYTINNPPNTPSNPSPPNHEPGVSINADLTWMGGDPDPGDTVTYDVYFGASSTPPLVSNDQSGTTYDPGTLDYGTKYYWKVVATDNHGASAVGPMWDFTTGVCGDVAPYPDCDGIINMGDVVLLLNYVGHPGEYELCCECCGDVAPCPASDGVINMGDVVLLLNYVGHPGEYQICCQCYDRRDLTVSSTTGGSVTMPGEGTFTYDQGTVVDLVAEAQEGYRFVNWSGDVATIANVDAASTDITMNDSYSITANFEEVVSFPDPNLEAAIREAIGKPTGPIYPSDLMGLTALQATDRNIVDLSGIEHCTNMLWLALSHNQITDLSPLANLTHVYFLSLNGNQISNISPLANLTSLTKLWISWNPIPIISPLAGLTNLTQLHLGGNQIDDISPLAGLTNLTDLSLEYNQISDISPLAGLTNLIYLYLSSNQIVDVSPLTNLTGLTWLSLESNQISDIWPLVANAGLGQGDYIQIRDNPLSYESVYVYIPELEARGVTVEY